MTTTNLSTTKGVWAALHAIGLQTTSPALAAISLHGKEDFLGCLTACIQGEDADGKIKKYLEGLLKCLEDSSIAALQAIVPEMTVDELIVAAKRGPTRFLSALTVAADKTNPRCGEATEYLLSLRGSPADLPQPSGAQASNVPAAPATPSRSVPPEAAPDRRAKIDEQCAPADSQAQKKHESQHVYGSNSALCFNATEWNGAATIMVDAAESIGLKSYDWKNSIHVSLKAVEIAACVAVLRRWRKEVKFEAHGSQNDKSFHLEFQGAHFFAKVSAKGAGVRAVKITSVDATAVSILFLRQLAAAYKGIPLSELLATVRATHQLDNAA